MEFLGLCVKANSQAVKQWKKCPLLAHPYFFFEMVLEKWLLICCARKYKLMNFWTDFFLHFSERFFDSFLLDRLFGKIFWQNLRISDRYANISFEWFFGLAACREDHSLKRICTQPRTGKTSFFPSDFNFFFRILSLLHS